MAMRYMTAGFIFLAGCGGTDGDDGAAACDPADRSGTYLMRYSERADGTCGDAPDTLVRLDPDGELGGGCSLDAPDEWSADQCRLTRSVTCCDGGYCTSVTGFTTQQDDSGATISGVMTFQIQEIGASGAVLDGCLSTYDVTATRQ